MRAPTDHLAKWSPIPIREGLNRTTNKPNMYLHRLIVQAFLICAACVTTLPAQTGAPHAQDSFSAVTMTAAGARAGYVGQAGCRNCHKHDKIWDNFYKDPHFKTVA